MLTVNDGAVEVTSSRMMTLNLLAGETTQIDLGGTGRAVVGRLEAPADVEGQVNWNFALIDVRPDLPKSISDDSLRFTVTVDRNGAFRIDDMPEGFYLLNVRFSRDVAGHLPGYRFVVPAQEENGPNRPINLGVLNLEKIEVTPNE